METLEEKANRIAEEIAQEEQAYWLSNQPRTPTAWAAYFAAQSEEDELAEQRALEEEDEREAAFMRGVAEDEAFANCSANR